MKHKYLCKMTKNKNQAEFARLFFPLEKQCYFKCNELKRHNAYCCLPLIGQCAYGVNLKHSDMHLFRFARQAKLKHVSGLPMVQNSTQHKHLKQIHQGVQLGGGTQLFLVCAMWVSKSRVYGAGFHSKIRGFGSEILTIFS